MDRFYKSFLEGKVNEGQNQPTWPPFICRGCNVSLNADGLCLGCHDKNKKVKKLNKKT